MNEGGIVGPDSCCHRKEIPVCGPEQALKRVIGRKSTPSEGS